MAIIKAINSKSGLKNIIEYITKENKTNKNIISGKDCNVNTALDEMMVTKKMWGKEKGR